MFPVLLQLKLYPHGGCGEKDRRWGQTLRSDLKVETAVTLDNAEDFGCSHDKK